MSPVHDQTYRRYGGRRVPPGRAWSVIVSTGVRAALTRKPFVGLLGLGAVFFLGRVIQIYFATMYPQLRQVAPVDARMFQSALEWQTFCAFFPMIYVGAGLIASDRRAHALQVYLSKPLSRVEYIAGKLGILLVFVLGLTLVPLLLLLLIQIGLSGSFELIRTSPGLVPSIVLASVVRAFVASVTLLALSAISNSTRYVAILYTGFVVFSEAFYGILRAVTGTTRVAWVSILGNIQVVTDAMFRQTPRYETPVVVSAIVLLGLVVVSLSVLERQVRGVEVVA